MDKVSAQNQMNSLGKERVPFIFIIDYKMKDILIYTLDNIPESILFSFHENNSLKQHNYIEPLISCKSIPDIGTYQKAFNEVRLHIKRGDTYLTNLTFSSEIFLHKSLKELFSIAQAKYKLLIDDKFLVFSPECFIKIENEKISTFPMKGTINASLNNAEIKLLSNIKEQSEHATIVDLLRNDMSTIAKNVTVETYRYLDRISTNHNELLQVSSKITGELPQNYNEKLGDILFSMLPAGSICGAPKKKTLEIIDKVEIHERGYYTGVFGIFDGTNLDSAVMIRFIEKIEGAYFYKSGGGITNMSDLNTEYDELKSKIYVPVG